MSVVEQFVALRAKLEAQSVQLEKLGALIQEKLEGVVFDG